MPPPTAIILIGPMGAGKTTIGALLAEQLGLPQYALDELRWDYYAEIGYSREVEKQIREAEGVAGALRYWKPFEVHAVEQLLADYQTGIFDFGAGHSVYDDPARLARVERALQPFRNVILLLPSPEDDESVRVLRERYLAVSGWDGMADGIDLHAYFVKHPANRRLAKHIVYTAGQTPEQTCAAILAWLDSPPT